MTLFQFPKNDLQKIAIFFFLTDKVVNKNIYHKTKKKEREGGALKTLTLVP